MFRIFLAAAVALLPLNIADAQCFDRWGNPTACPVSAAPSGYHVEKRPAGLLGLRTKEVLVANTPVVDVVFQPVSDRYGPATSGGGNSTGKASHGGAPAYSTGETFAHWGPMTAAERAVSERYGAAQEPAAVVDAPAAGSAACDCERCDKIEATAEKNAADIQQIKQHLGIRAGVGKAIKDAMSSHAGPQVSIPRHSGPAVVLSNHRGPAVVISSPSQPGYTVAMR